MTVMSLLMVLVLMLMLLLQFRMLHASGGVGGGVMCDQMPSRAGNGRQVVNSNLVPMSKLASLVRCKFVLNIHFCSHAPSSDPTREKRAQLLWSNIDISSMVNYPIRLQ